MKQFILTIAVMALASIGVAQNGPRPLPTDPTTQYGALRTYLTLTDAQVTALTDIRQAETTALTTLADQANEKRVALEAELKLASPNPTVVGQLVVSIRDLETKMSQPQTGARNKALAVLTEAQRSKLASLAVISTILEPASNAMELNLIDRPTQGFMCCR